MTLCSLCQTIPPNLFSSARDTQCMLPHQPNYPALEASAQTGCPLCAIFVDAVRKTCTGPDLVDTWGKPLDRSKPVLLRSTKFAEQWVFIGGDRGKIRGLEVPPDWQDIESHSPQREVREAATIKAWLEKCWKEHPECHSASAQASTFIPTRVVDVGDGADENANVRLIATRYTADIRDKRYVALSHCWGLTMPDSARTITSNLGAHLESIALADLTQTFVDAIHIARRIGVRYVWIDSLCIIQDSLADWQAEAAQMADVYSNAYVTISASGSADGTGGCRLGDDNDLPSGPVCLSWGDFESGLGEGQQQQQQQQQQHKKIHVWSQPASPVVNVLLQDPLTQRGWTLQERELSPRVAHYSKDSIRWECRALKASLQFPWGDSIAFNGADRIFDAGQLDKSIPLTSNEGGNTDQNRRVWFDVVRRYTLRSLTKQTDILPAISGIARSIQAVTGDSYHAGMWQSYGALSLLWHVQGEHRKEAQKSVRPAEYIAPSWSWASVKGRIQYAWGLDNTDPADIDATFTPTILSFLTEPLLVPSPDHPYGMLKAGRLHIKGKVKPAIARWNEADGLDRSSRGLISPGINGIVGSINFDVPTDQCDLVFCLACHREDKHGWIHALGLAPVDISRKELRRVGIVSSKNKEWWADAVVMDVIII